MPRGPVDKNELKSYIFRLKHQLDDEVISPQEKHKAHQYLSRVLDKIEEYGY